MNYLNIARVSFTRSPRRWFLLICVIALLASLAPEIGRTVHAKMEPSGNPATAAPAATFTVINTNDSGAGSLRQAIIDANTNPGLDTISFNIGSGPQTITPIQRL